MNIVYNFTHFFFFPWNIVTAMFYKEPKRTQQRKACSDSAEDDYPDVGKGHIQHFELLETKAKCTCISFTYLYGYCMYMYAYMYIYIVCIYI